jgi:uncharacterized protein YcbX
VSAAGSQPGEIRVSALATTPVKGLRITPRTELELEATGARDDRRFYLIDEAGRMVNGKGIGALSAIVADYEHGERRLSLRFPDAETVTGKVEAGPAIATRFFSLQINADLVPGPWSEAISDYVGRPLRLVEAGPARSGVDRGGAGAVTLLSRASLQRLATEAGRDEVDARRFRMLIEVDGTEPHAEDAWVGRRLRIGAALIAIEGHVGRCLVTSRDPETGVVDLPTLDVLRSYRGDAPTTEPLPFGVYGAVLEPGTVRVGDAVTPLTRESAAADSS